MAINWNQPCLPPQHSPRFPALVRPFLNFPMFLADMIWADSPSDSTACILHRQLSISAFSGSCFGAYQKNFVCDAVNWIAQCISAFYLLPHYFEFPLVCDKISLLRCFLFGKFRILRFSCLQYPQLKTIFHLLAFLFPPRFPLGLRFCLSISFLRLLVSNSCQHLIPLLASNSISALNLSVIGKLKKFNRLTGLLGLTNLSLIWIRLSTIGKSKILMDRSDYWAWRTSLWF